MCLTHHLSVFDNTGAGMFLHFMFQQEQGMWHASARRNTAEANVYPS